MDEKTEAAYKRLLLWAVEHQEPHSSDILIIINEYISSKKAASVIIKGLAGAIPDAVQQQRAMDKAAGIAALPATLELFQRIKQSNRGREKRGTISPLKQTLKAIKSYNALISMMVDEDALDDFNESDPPHPCKLNEIEDDRLNYIVRKSGNNKSVTLGRIENIFRYELK